MYKRYRGNSGRVEYVPEPRREPPRRPAPPPPDPILPPSGPGPSRPGSPGPRPPGRPGLFPPALQLETEDLLLLLILYFLYRESGDSELLMIIGAMLFL